MNGAGASATPGSSPIRLSPPTWLLVLAWIYLMACGLRVVFNLAQGALGVDPLSLKVGIRIGTIGPVELPVWWAVMHIAAEVGFGIGCVALLLRDRDLVWFAIIAGWVIAVFQCGDALIGIFRLRFELPLSAFVYAAMAWRSAALLRAEHPAPPRSLGTI